MKLYTFQTLATLFVAIFALTKGEETEDDGATTNTRGRRLGAVSAVSVVPNTGSASDWSAAYATSQSVKITFTTAVSLANTEFVYIHFPEGFTFNVGTATDCTSTQIVGTFTETVSNQILSLERDGSSSAFSAGTATITCTNIKYPAPYRPSSPQKTGKFVVWTTTDQTKGSVDYVGIPLIYYARSDCKVGGLIGGALADCDDGSSSDCKKCTGANGFVLESGLQKAATGAGVSCIDGQAAKRQHRCNAMYGADTYLDVAVNTNGNFGTLTCGAYTAGASSVPAYNIMQDPSTDKKSASSVMVDISRRYDDQVVTLSDLPSDTLFDIYCHMDDYIMSPALTDVRTDENNRIWGDSLVPGTTVTGVSPSTITLTFKHGLALDNTATITLKAYYGTDTAVFTDNPQCTATTNGNALALDVVTTSDHGLRDSTDNEITVFDLDANSAAGSQIVLVCNTELTTNPAVHATNGRVQYDLTVSGHPVALKNRYGWKTTSS
jgi:hypothetical protein